VTEHPEGTHVGTQGASPNEAVGLRNRVRAEWRGLSFEQRAGVSIGAEIALAILFFFVDRALGYAVLTVSALYWIHRLPPLPWKLAAQAVLVVLFLVLGPASFGILLAIAFAVFWVPARWRALTVPAVAIGAAVFYPFYQPKMFTIPVFGAWPDVATGVVMLVFVMMAVGLNIVVGYAGLLDLGYVAFYATGAYTAAWFASQQFAGQKCPKPGVSVENCPVAAVPAHNFDFGAVGLVPGAGGIHISWIAIREDETAAAAMGIPLMRTKTWAYASGAFFGGVAGAYYAIFRSATFPGDFFFNISVFILCMVILGGMGNIWGVIVGAAFLAYLDREGLANTGAWINSNIHVGHWHPNIEVPLYASGIYGVIILIVMLFRPEGLIPSRRRAAELHEGVHDEPLYDAAHAGAEA
jgi:ABC-type branched-subunit amino acid transport system permease subunit